MYYIYNICVFANIILSLFSVLISLCHNMLEGIIAVRGMLSTYVFLDDTSRYILRFHTNYKNRVPFQTTTKISFP